MPWPGPLPLNPVQPELIRTAIARMPVGSEIVSAMDADEDGAKLAGVVRKAVELSGRTDLRATVQEPFGFKDWNIRYAQNQNNPSLTGGRTFRRLTAGDR